MAGSKKRRPYAWEKINFLEDANEDSRIAGAAFRVLQKICAAYNREDGYAECARTFIVDRVPVTIKTVQRARKVLLDEGRVFIVRKPLGRASTRYGVNWWYRGADKIRAANGGKAIFDIRVEGTFATKSKIVEGTLTSGILDTDVPSTGCRGDIMSPKPINIPQGGNIYIAEAPCTRAGLSAAGARASADRVVEISKAEIENDDDETWLKLTLNHEDGTTELFAICVESTEQAVQERGEKRMSRLLIALNIDASDNPDDFCGIPFVITAGEDFQPLEDIEKQAA